MRNTINFLLSLCAVIGLVWSFINFASGHHAYENKIPYILLFGAVIGFVIMRFLFGDNEQK